MKRRSQSGPFSIRGRLVLLTAVITVAMTSAFSGIYFLAARTETIRRVREAAERSLQRLQVGLEMPIWNMEWDTCDTLSQSELNEQNIAGVAITDVSGRTPFGYLRTRGRSGNEVTRAMSDQEVLALGSLAGIVQSGPINHASIKIATATVYADARTAMSILVSNLLVATLLAFCVGTGIGATLFFVVDRIITSRLNALGSVVERFAARDLAARADEMGGDVIGNLAASFNEMASTIEDYNHSLESMVEERTARLVESEKLAFMGGLTAGVVHEVNTPLGVAVTASTHVHSVADSVLSGYRTGSIDEAGFVGGMEEILEGVGLISTNLTKAAEFMNTFKKLASDQAVEERRPVKVAEYIRETLLSLKPRLKHSKVEVRIQCPEDLEIVTVPGTIYQVITNLVTNSLSHAFEDGSGGTVSISAAERDGALAIVYRDDGKGIPPENLARIFDPFFTTKRGKGGTGLGLHIVKTIVTKQGGTIECLSSPGAGVEFRVSIPVAGRDAR